MVATKDRAATNGGTATRTSGRTKAAETLAVEDVSAEVTGMMRISPLPAARMLVPIVGVTPLIVNRWDEKAKKKMLDEMMGIKNPKRPKDPDAEYLASMYHTKEGGYGFPVVGFKAAIVSAARFYGKEVSMVRLRQCLFLTGIPSHDDKQLLTPIVGVPRSREDAVTVGMKGRDLRYRAEFLEWEATLDVTYITSMLDGNSVLSLIDAAGRGVGVGEWRPEKSGQNGTFTVDPSTNIRHVED
jgi:hypothetical protein